MAAATSSRCSWVSRQGHDGLGRRDSSSPFFASYCTHGTSASSLVRSYTSRSLGARHLRACPVREVVTVAWDPRPRAPVEGVLRAAGMLKSQTLERRGKWWLGQRR
ncbi:hypothetical protein Taro_021402 [Colocasia esculenta]|uniref:Uncharacterized protein n=1 Tax=Colocasia esculenta TaxID=4460 RepID=A0A843VBE3_COLES|nr:hypothetical protein [Colocasia esculenta]